MVELKGFVTFKTKYGGTSMINISYISGIFASKPSETEICTADNEEAIIIPMAIDAVVDEIKKQTKTK